ncbi:MAG: hypothetical protein Q4C96_05760 [Planctomycetia bacterium]|nr:hypothetical protein [Planctomycetia bacterium]
MKTYYILPCPCGKKHEILPTEAGNLITCECQNIIEIPPFRELQKLEKIEKTENMPAISESENILGKEGGIRQQRIGQLLLALFLGISFSAYGFFCYITRPTLPEFSRMNAYETWVWWQKLRAGVTVPMDRDEFFLSHQIDVSWRWVYIMAALSILCFIWILAVLLAPAVKKTRKKK